MSCLPAFGLFCFPIISVPDVTYDVQELKNGHLQHDVPGVVGDVAYFPNRIKPSPFSCKS